MTRYNKDIRIVIEGCGSFLPKKTVTNDELSLNLNTSDEWIYTRTGIKSRHLADPEIEKTSDMALMALQNALLNAGLTHKDLDVVIVATATPDSNMPSTASIVQNKLGMMQGISFDINAACSGFVYALQIGCGLVCSSEVIRRVAIIGAETMSRLVDWSDRSTCVLFGDGAGAVIIKGEYSLEESIPCGVVDITTYNRSSLSDLLATRSSDGYLSMKGQEVFRHAVREMAAIARDLLIRNNLSIDKISWLLVHQANSRILEVLANEIGMPMIRVLNFISDHANTSAASIPLAFDHSISCGYVKRGDLIMMLSAGAGMTFGGALLYY